MNNYLEKAFKELSQEEQEAIMIAFMKNPKQAFDVLWDLINDDAA